MGSSYLRVTDRGNEKETASKESTEESTAEKAEWGAREKRTEKEETEAKEYSLTAEWLRGSFDEGAAGEENQKRLREKSDQCLKEEKVSFLSSYETLGICSPETCIFKVDILVQPLQFFFAH